MPRDKFHFLFILDFANNFPELLLTVIYLRVNQSIKLKWPKINPTNSKDRLVTHINLSNQINMRPDEHQRMAR